MNDTKALWESLAYESMTWQERWYYRVGFLTGWFAGLAVALLFGVAWWVMTAP